MKLFIKVFSLILLFFTIVAAGCNSKNTNKDRTLNDTILLVSPNSLPRTDTIDPAGDLPGTVNDNSSAIRSAALGPEQSFINYAVEKNRQGILQLKAALKHSTLKDMKQYALPMLKDHDAFAKDLKKYIDTHPYFKMPPVAKINSFATNENAGNAWDKSWTEKMIEDDGELLLKLRSASADIRDPDFIQLIINTIPVIASHVSMARSLQAKLQIITPE